MSLFEPPWQFAQPGDEPKQNADFTPLFQTGASLDSIVDTLLETAPAMTGPWTETAAFTITTPAVSGALAQFQAVFPQDLPEGFYKVSLYGASNESPPQRLWWELVYVVKDR